jgi:UDP-N-acetylglucosamine acyltransferase
MGSKIHPTATVHPSAVIAHDVEVGPNCIIDGPATIGAGTRLIAGVYLSGKVVLGERNVVYPNTCLGFEPQDRKFDPIKGTGGVAIGNDNILREGVTIHRATGSNPTRLGDNNLLMCNAHVGHDSVVANGCTMANVTALAGHVTLQDSVILGGGAMVHQFCRIGRLVMISGLVGIAQDVPPFCTSYSFRTVGSLNMIGLRRNGYRAHIGTLKQAFRILFMSRHSRAVAVDAMEREFGSDALVAEMVAFCRGTKRGITPYKQLLAEQEVES